MSPPARVGRFVVTRQIGEGAMGRVFAAIDPKLDRAVALKVLKPEFTGQADNLARLRREAQAMAKLSHPNVVTIFEVDETVDSVFIVMEHVDGTDLRGWRKAAPRTAAEVVNVYWQAARGLAAAHGVGMVHRDIKPDNLLIGSDGRVRVSDFGLVAAGFAMSSTGGLEYEERERPQSLTWTGAVLGTPPYMAPEAHRGEDLSAKADQFSFCVALWEALAMMRPFRGGSYAELATNIATENVVGESELPAALRPIVRRGLAADPAGRWPSMDALAVQLQDWLDAQSTPPKKPETLAETPAVAAAANSAITKPRTPWLALALAALATTGGIAAWWSLRDPDSQAKSSGSQPPLPVPQQLVTPSTCTYMPAFSFENELFFDDGISTVYRMKAGQNAEPITGRQNGWRIHRGKDRYTMVFLSGGRLATLDLLANRISFRDLKYSSVSGGAGALFATRADIPEIWVTRESESRSLLTMPAGKWAYTVAAASNGRTLAITTAAERSMPSICIAKLTQPADVYDGDIECIERNDITTGRAAISANGSELYYQTTLGIFHRDVKAKLDQLWLAGPIATGGIDLSPDGSTLAYSTSRPFVEYRNLASNQALAIDAHQGAVTTRDGRWYFVRNGKTAGLLELVEKKGNELRVIHSGPNIGRLDVNAEGTLIAFEVFGNNGGIYVIDPTGYPAVRMTDVDGDAGPAFSGKLLVFTRYDEKKHPWLYSVDPNQGPRSMSSQPLLPLPRESTGSVAATGEVIIREPGKREMIAWHPSDRSERVIDHEIMSAGESGIASPDGQWFYAPNAKVSELWRVPIPTGPNDERKAERVLAAKPCGLVGWPTITWHGEVFVTEKGWRGELFVVPLSEDSPWSRARLSSAER